jgi:hypothetical protein
MDFKSQIIIIMFFKAILQVLELDLKFMVV